MNGSKYVGDWREDKYDGYGVETWSNNDKYEGLYENGKKKGVGTF